MKPPFDAIIWWEKRRILFNLALFFTGIGGFLIITVIGSQFSKLGEDVIEPMIALVGGAIYGILANICYTLSWISELAWSNGDTSKTKPLRAKIFRRGLLFSVLLTASPAVFIPLAWLIFGIH